MWCEQPRESNLEIKGLHTFLCFSVFLIVFAHFVLFSPLCILSYLCFLPLSASLLRCPPPPPSPPFVTNHNRFLFFLPLFLCSQLLIQSEADLFVEDEEKLTPCDLAERHHHTELALSLESQMVFSPPSAQQSSADTHGETALLQYKEVRAQMQHQGGFPVGSWSRFLGHGSD